MTSLCLKLPPVIGPKMSTYLSLRVVVVVVVGGGGGGGGGGGRNKGRLRY